MSKKKSTITVISQEEQAQVQQIFDRYHQIADDLHRCQDQKQAASALAEIHAMPEAAQVTLLKELAKANHVDAADVLNALHEVSPLKNVCKEARRSLIRLEGAKVYPEWALPKEALIKSIQPTIYPPRFWKGVIIETPSIDRVELFLCWEQGADYGEIRMMGFLLNLTVEGVQDLFTRMEESKRSFELFIAEQRSKRSSDEKIRSCTLAEARDQLSAAIKVNKLLFREFPDEYYNQLSLIQELIFESKMPEDLLDLEEEDEEEDEDILHLHPAGVVFTFLRAWTEEDYDLAYKLLSRNSLLREGLSADEWTAKRQIWAEEARPYALQLEFMYEVKQPKPSIWVPSLVSAAYTANRRGIEMGWSIEADETELSESLPEFPEATAHYEETGRSWFWTRYILVEEEGEWRIQSMDDEGAHAQNLSVEELQQNLEEMNDALQDFMLKHQSWVNKSFSEPEMWHGTTEVISRAMHKACLIDILIKKLPLDYTLYVSAGQMMITLAQYERSLVYLYPLVERFTNGRKEHFWTIGRMYIKQCKAYKEQGNDFRVQRCLELGKKALHESLAIENNFNAHESLAELSFMGGELDEAEKHLLLAREVMTKPQEQEWLLELHLGEVARDRKNYQEALNHFQRVVTFEPDASLAWYNLGLVHSALEQFTASEASFKRAIALDPEEELYYRDLSSLYKEHGYPAKATKILEQGVEANPDSLSMHLNILNHLVNSGDYRQAEFYLKRAEQIDPQAQPVHVYRHLIKVMKHKKQSLIATQTVLTPQLPAKRERRQKKAYADPLGENSSGSSM